MSRTTLLERRRISVSDFRCTAGPGDKPFAEQYRLPLDLLCPQGQFRLPLPRHVFTNWWRDRCWSAIPATNIPAPMTTSAATNACRSSWIRNWWKRSATRTDIWRIGSAPPLPELMVLGELAQAAADGSSDIGLDEIGQMFASRFVEVVSGKPRKVRPGRRPRPPPRGGNRALDRRPFAPADRSRGCRCASRHQPVPFPAAVLGRARRHPAPISGALAAAPCGAAAGR